MLCLRSFLTLSACVGHGNINSYSIDSPRSSAFKTTFADEDAFSEGHTLVKIGAKWGFINRTGQAVISLQFEDGNGFHEGLSAVQTGNAGATSTPADGLSCQRALRRLMASMEASRWRCRIGRSATSTRK